MRGVIQENIYLSTLETRKTRYAAKLFIDAINLTCRLTAWRNQHMLVYFSLVHAQLGPLGTL